MSKTNKLAKKILLSLMAGMTSALPSAFALPDQGAYDNSAYASIVVNGNVMNITGNYGNNIINWRTFSIDSDETVKFMDKNNYLNLVNGFDISRINGTISGGDIVYLINPYGILFGSGATLDNVGSFVASTRDISDINQENFIHNPADVQNVLYSDNHRSKNQDYLPDNSTYLPVISVANINLTNVPRSATKIVLDGPNGVILGSTDILNKISFVSTRISNGEIGIGTADGNSPTLTAAQKEKIYLTHGGDWFPYSNETDIIQPYKQIHNISELQAIDQEIKNISAPYRYLLSNNIDASNYDFSSLGSSKAFSGRFDGMGYEISNLSNSGQGLFASFSGTLRNLGLKNANINGGNIPVGGIAGYFSGSMSNVYVTGTVKGKNLLGGLVGHLYKSGDKISEIRNSHNDATVENTGNGPYTGGIVGQTDDSSLYNDYNTGQITGSESGIGGIAGAALRSEHWSNPLQVRILSVYNKGNLEGYGPVGGITGDNTVSIGDAYNWGDTTASGWEYNNYWLNKIGYGGITGKGDKYWDGGMEWKSKVNGQRFNNYYWAWGIGIDSGIKVSWSELNSIFNANYGKRNVTVGVTTPIIPNFPPAPEPANNQNPAPNTPNAPNPTNNPVPSTNQNNRGAFVNPIVTRENPSNNSAPSTNQNNRGASVNLIDKLKDDKAKLNGESAAVAEAEYQKRSTAHQIYDLAPLLRNPEYNNALTAKDEMRHDATELYNNRINGTSETSPFVFQEFTKNATRRVKAYADSSLTTQVDPVEVVSVGDEITVIGETENAYEVVYYSEKINDYKTRWVKKDEVFAEPIKQTYTPNNNADYLNWGGTGDTNFDTKVREFMNDERYSPNNNIAGLDCGAYVNAFVQYVYGLPYARQDDKKYVSADDIQSGDVIHVNGTDEKNPHYIVVLSRNGDRLTTIEGNWWPKLQNGKGQTVYSESQYYIKDHLLYRESEGLFRNWDCGYHYR